MRTFKIFLVAGAACLAAAPAASACPAVKVKASSAFYVDSVVNAGWLILRASVTGGARVTALEYGSQRHGNGSYDFVAHKGVRPGRHVPFTVLAAKGSCRYRLRTAPAAQAGGFGGP